MKFVSSLWLAAVAPAIVSAFSNTHPLVAWSSIELESLSPLLSTTPKSFFASSPQSPLSAHPSTPICDLTNLLVLSIPNLHYSDLSLLPSTSSLRHSLASAAVSHTDAYLPLPVRRNLGVEDITKRFVAECGAVVETEQGEKHFWKGKAGKVVRVIEVPGLEEWELVGKKARQGRQRVVEEIDDIVSAQLSGLAQDPYLVILSTLNPVSFKSITSLAAASAPKRKSHPHHHKVAKRAIKEVTSDDADTESLLEEIVNEVEAEIEEMNKEEDAEATEEENSPTATQPTEEEQIEDGGMASIEDPEFDYSYTDFDSTAPDAEATSIFAIPPNAGLLHKYVFFTPPLVFSILLTLLVLLPASLLGANILMSTETLAGLETKMTGTVGLDPSKA